MPSVSRAAWRARAMRRRRDRAGSSCPLVFSLAGLLMNGLALMVPSEDGYLALLRFALIASAPLLAGMAALHFAGSADAPYP
jgi:hypothetical protein